MTLTGKSIATNIKKLEEEVKEFDYALGEIDSGTAPYRLLENARREKQRELTELESTVWVQRDA